MQIEYLADHPQHVEALARLHFAEWGDLNPGQTLAMRIASTRKACGRGGVPSTVVALDGGVLVGSAALVERDMHDRPDLTPWLAGVYVRPEYRRRGVASALVRRVEADAAAAGIHVLYLYTPDADGLYARLGWSELERRRYRNIDAIIMTKQLRAG